VDIEHLYPVIALRAAVLFPGVTTPITAGRPATVRAVEAALREGGDERVVFVAAQRDESAQPSKDGLYAVGVIAAVTNVQRLSDGYSILLSCKERASARYSEHEGVVRATVVPFRDLDTRTGDDLRLDPLVCELRDHAIEYGRFRGVSEEILRQFIGDIRDAGTLVNHVAFYLDLSTAEKQEILELDSVEQRLQLLDERLRHLFDRALYDRARSSDGGHARPTARSTSVSQAVGDGDGDLVDRLTARVLAADPPEDALIEARRELARLRRMANAASPEAHVIASWLEWVADLPWHRRTQGPVNLDVARRLLDADHHGLTDVKERALDLLAVHRLRTDRARETSHGPILLFLGPPGTGKTSIAASIARAMGRTMVRVSLGGVHDEADIRGHRRTYVGAMPGRLLAAMRRARSRDPVVVLDEIDKLGASHHGDPGAALLEALDPAQNSNFVDHYLGVPFDLSEVLFICTANLSGGIPPALFDRLEPIAFPGYTEPEKLQIARRTLLPRQAKAHALDEAELRVSDAALRTVIASYTREAGVRQLDRAVATIARKVARGLVTGELDSPAVTTEAEVRAMLGRPEVFPERRLDREVPGVATGMYYTPNGGDVMHVEVSVLPGRGDLTLTGQLGDVMRESGQAALTCARALGRRFGVSARSMAQRDFHVHVPAGALPKEGPSAGLPIVLALLSALANRPVRSDLAATGEITLRGRVLAIGGVREKVLGAHRAGITDVLLPRDNEADLEDVAEEVRQAMTFHLVETIDEAVSIALRPRARRTS
jgi:ATP-dependent Lon protease